MRSANQIGSTVSEWHELQRTERAKTLAALLAQLQDADESGAEWYSWINDGQQPVSQEWYAEHGKFGKKRQKATA